MLVSVVICTYNRAHLLRECMESLAGQTAEKDKYEMVVVDNNSSDSTPETARSLGKNFEHFKYVMEPAQGLSHARNAGWREARGDYVAYIDDDARADKKWVEKIISFASRRPDIVAFGGPYKRFCFMEFPDWFKESYESFSLGNIERSLRENEWINGTNMVFKRALLPELGGFDIRVGMCGEHSSYGEETKLLLRIINKKYPVYYVPDVLVEHLVPEYKLTLLWNLKSYYLNGFSAFDTFGFEKKPFKQLLKTLYLFFICIGKFPFVKEKYLKTKILECFSELMWNLGLAVRMFK